MGVYTKLKFMLIDLYYNLKNNIRNSFDRTALNIKYSPFFTKLFTKINHKTLFVLICTYILFISIQLYLFTTLWRPQDIDEPKNKGYLSRFIFNYKKMGFDIENKLKNYTIQLENFGKDISVPFYLNWIVDIQKRLKKEIRKNKNIKTLFIFNHHGRLLNFIPNIEKFRNTNYQFTPYLKNALYYFSKNKTPYIYFYTDSKKILNKYRLQKGTYLEKSKDFICVPFYSKKLLKKSDKMSSEITLDINMLFKKQSYTDDHVPYLMLFTPIYNQVQTMIGIAGFNIDIDSIFKEAFLKNDNQFHTFVVNDDGVIVYSLNKKLIGRYILYDKMINALVQKDKEVLLFKNVPFLKYQINVSGKTWNMIARIDPNKLTAAMKQVPIYNPLLYVFFIIEGILFISLFLLFNKHITRPINNFSTGLNNLSKGHHMEKIEINHTDEFKLIENRFNNLTDKVKGYLVFGKTISRELVDEYLENHPAADIKTEEKAGTILFLKIKNIVEIKTRIHQEEFDILMNKFLNDIEISVSQHKGFIESFSSDSILAIFGIPVNGYNHAQNAYECSKKIFKNIRLFNKLNNIDFKISMSINTGDVFYSQMQSNYGKLLVSLGNTIKKAYYYESIINPSVLALSDKTMNILYPKPKMQKIIHLRIKDQEETDKVFLASI